MAYLEAYVDFPDEDIPDDALMKLQNRLSTLNTTLEQHINNPLGERVRDGFHVALVGVPNVGKSSLLNAFAGRDVAIVSDTPGTTRDSLEVQLDVGGYAITLYDTAGMRESEDEIEQQGVTRAQARANAANIILAIVDASAPELPSTVDVNDPRVLVIANKSDCGRYGAAQLHVSAQTGDGMAELINVLEQRILALADAGTQPLFTRARHHMLARETLDATMRAEEALQTSVPLELVAEELRLAATALSRLTGAIDVEDVLDSIFTSFCIGK